MTIFQRVKNLVGWSAIVPQSPVTITKYPEVGNAFDLVKSIYSPKHLATIVEMDDKPDDL